MMSQKQIHSLIPEQFNMMSLHSMGSLEEHFYGSINFFLYNWALMPLTVLIFFGGVHFLFWYRTTRSSSSSNNLNSLLGSTISRPTINAVGYSGVLFAWMVVSSLEQTRTCPIPFFTNVCFDTWHITQHLKFNVGPMIQLVIAQVILPRVSLGGHLAGVIAGFLLHWSLLPLEIVQPSVLIPAITLLQWRIRQFIPLSIDTGGISSTSTARGFLDVPAIDDEKDNETPNGQGSGSTAQQNSVTAFLGGLVWSHGKGAGMMGMSHLLSVLRLSMILLLMASFVIMKLTSSLLYSQGILFLQFHFCIQCYSSHWDDEGEQEQWSPQTTKKKQQMLVQWKGFIVSCVLVLIMDSMTLACWMLMGNAMSSPTWTWFACIILVLRMTVNIMALSLGCKHWEEIGGKNEVKGIFEYVFGFCVLTNAKVVGHRVFSLWIASMGCQRLKRSISQQHSAASNSSSCVPSSPNSRRAKSRVQSLAADAAERRSRAAIQESEVL
jgi:hypothetical protein